MEKEARITSKGQITVPREIRRVLGVRPGDSLLFKVTKRGYGCGPSGLRAHSRNLKELGTPELIPAGRELFVGFGSFVGDDDSRRH